MNSIFNFMFTEKHSARSVPLSHSIPPLRPKTNRKMSLLVEDLTVSTKTLEIDQI